MPINVSGAARYYSGRQSVMPVVSDSCSAARTAAIAKAEKAPFLPVLLVHHRKKRRKYLRNNTE